MGLIIFVTMSYIPLSDLSKRVVYEDNHLIAINKRAGEIIQGDKTGDQPLSEAVKAFLKERDNKPGKVFLGVTHRLDRPVSGVCLFAKTSKALGRVNKLFSTDAIEKKYLALVENKPKESHAELRHYLTRNVRQNKSYAHSKPVLEAKEALLQYTYLGGKGKYHLVEVKLITGRHHQIRCQLAAVGMPIKGDVKYGARQPNHDGSISLHAFALAFIHPVRNSPVVLEVPPLFL